MRILGSKRKCLNIAFCISYISAYQRPFGEFGGKKNINDCHYNWIFGLIRQSCGVIYSYLFIYLIIYSCLVTHGESLDIFPDGIGMGGLRWVRLFQELPIRREILP